MTDHNRGAYTPNHDAPLAFDARQSRGGGRRGGFPTTLVVSLLILVGLGGAIVMFYRSGVRGAGEAPTPVGAPVGEIKSAPDQAQQTPQDAGQGLQIYKSEGKGDAAPADAAAPADTFAPPPEQPAARPVTRLEAHPVAPVAAQAIAPAAPPSAATVAASGATAHAAPQPLAPPAALAPAKPAAVAQAKPAAHAPAHDEIGDLLGDKPAAKVAQNDTPKPPPTRLLDNAPKPVAAAHGAAPHGAAMVQIGAFSSEALAGQEWGKLATSYGSDMHGKGKMIEAVDHGGKTLYRTAVSGFASREAAVEFCGKLKAAGRACIVK